MSYLVSEALCPYFKSDGVEEKLRRKFIRCEFGKIFFEDPMFYQLFGYGVCALNCNECTFKKMLDKEYRQMDEQGRKAALKRYKNNIQKRRITKTERGIQKGLDNGKD